MGYIPQLQRHIAVWKQRTEATKCAMVSTWPDLQFDVQIYFPSPANFFPLFFFFSDFYILDIYLFFFLHLRCLLLVPLIFLQLKATKNFRAVLFTAKIHLNHGQSCFSKTSQDPIACGLCIDLIDSDPNNDSNNRHVTKQKDVLESCHVRDHKNLNSRGENR